MASKSMRRARKREQRLATSPETVTKRRNRGVVAPQQRQTPPSRERPGFARLLARPYVWAIVAVVLFATASLVGLSVLSGRHASTSPASPAAGRLTGVASTAALVRGVPQQGNVLGSSAAPVRLVEYADPQCPYCAQYARDVLPTLVRDYVRTGKVQLVYRGLSFIGPDSSTALRTATAAGAQRRMWNVLELMYRNQGPENAWVTDAMLRSIVNASGAEAARVFRDRESAVVARTTAGWSGSAQASGVNAVPAFFYARRGAPLQRLEVSALTAPEFRAALDRTLQR